MRQGSLDLRLAHLARMAFVVKRMNFAHQSTYASAVRMRKCNRLILACNRANNLGGLVGWEFGEFADILIDIPNGIGDHMQLRVFVR